MMDAMRLPMGRASFRQAKKRNRDALMLLLLRRMLRPAVTLYALKMI